MNNQISEFSFLEILDRKVVDEGGPTLFGKKYGLSPQFMSSIMIGAQPLPKRVLNELGYSRTVVKTVHYLREGEP